MCATWLGRRELRFASSLLWAVRHHHAPRCRALGACNPWNRMRCSLGHGTSAARVMARHSCSSCWRSWASRGTAACWLKPCGSAHGIWERSTSGAMAPCKVRAISRSAFKDTSAGCDHGRGCFRLSKSYRLTWFSPPLARAPWGPSLSSFHAAHASVREVGTDGSVCKSGAAGRVRTGRVVRDTQWLVHADQPLAAGLRCQRA